MRRGRNIGRTGLAGLALCAALSGSSCADFARATSLAPDPVDTTSAVAAQVRQASRADLARPRFRDIPAAPTDVRPLGAWRSSVQQTGQAGAALTAWLAANPAVQPAESTEAFAAAQRASIPADERQAAPADPAGTDDFAARLRALAAPPPPPK